MVRVVPHQSREIECDRKSGLSLRQEVLVSRIRLGGGTKPSELPHRPELAAITGRVDSASKREFAWNLSGCSVASDVESGIERLDHVPRIGEKRIALRSCVKPGAPLRDFFAQSIQLQHFSRCHGLTPVSSGPLRLNNSSATLNGVAVPASIKSS